MFLSVLKFIGIFIGVLAILVGIAYLVIRIKEVYYMRSITNFYRGTRAERRFVGRLCLCHIPKENVFHDLYLEYAPNKYTQIDVVILTPVGLFVCESKDYKGWIFGQGHEEYWTASYLTKNYRSKTHRFFSPIKQNEIHISCLRNVLGDNYKNYPIYSFVMFENRTTLKKIKNIPANTCVAKSISLIKYLNSILKVSTPVANYDENYIRTILRQSVENGKDEEIRQKHLADITNRYGKQPTQSPSVLEQIVLFMPKINRFFMRVMPPIYQACKKVVLFIYHASVNIVQKLKK